MDHSFQRIGSLCFLCDMLFPRASSPASAPSSLIPSSESGSLLLDEDWRRRYFPLFKKHCRFLSSSICGRRMIAVVMTDDDLRECRLEMQFLTFNNSDPENMAKGERYCSTAKAMVAHLVALGTLGFKVDLDPFLPGLSERIRLEAEMPRPDLTDVRISKIFPIAFVTLDGPRALLSAFSHSFNRRQPDAASRPESSFFSTFQPKTES